MKLAVCIHSKDSRELKRVISEKYSNLNIVFFEGYDDDIFKSLWKLSVIKTNYEITNYIDFDVCMAVMSDDISMFDHTVILPPDHNVIYYHSGRKIKNHFIDISLTNFYSRSLEFDRVCECYHHTHLSRINKIENNTLSNGTLLFCHIKSLTMNIKCINYEDSNLFIRSTQIN